MSQITSLLQKLPAWVTAGLDISTERFSSEKEYILALNLYFMRLNCFTTFMGVVLFAPFDFWYLAEHPKTLKFLLLWRGIFGLVAFLSWRWSLRYEPAHYRIHHWIVMGSIWVSITCSIGTQLGPFTEPWVYLGLLVPIVTALMVGTFGERISANLALAIAGIVSAMVVDPGYFVTSHTPVFAGYFLLSVILAMLAGDLYTRRLVHNYRSFVSLQKYNDSLEELVEQKAREAALLTLDAKIIEERTRLALSRDVHDELGHEIALQNISLYHFLNDHLEHPEHKALAETLIRELQQIERNTHKIVKELRGTPILENPISLSLLEWLYAFGKANDIEFEALVEPEELHFDRRLSFVLSQVIQEALTNVQKHSEAGKVEVCIFQEPGQLLLSIRDDGKGFVPEEHQDGTGLRSIEERLNTLNGTFEILSSPDAGTEYIAILPHHGSHA